MAAGRRAGWQTCRQKLGKRASDRRARSPRGNPSAQFRTFKRESPTSALLDLLRESLHRFVRDRSALAAGKCGVYMPLLLAFLPQRQHLLSPPLSRAVLTAFSSTFDKSLLAAASARCSCGYRRCKTARNGQPAVRAELVLRAVGVKAEAQRDGAQRGALTPTSTGPRLAAAGCLCSERFADAPTLDFAGALAQLQPSLRSVGASRAGPAPAAPVVRHLSERRQDVRRPQSTLQSTSSISTIGTSVLNRRNRAKVYPSSFRSARSFRRSLSRLPPLHFLISMTR